MKSGDGPKVVTLRPPANRSTHGRDGPGAGPGTWTGTYGAPAAVAALPSRPLAVLPDEAEIGPPLAPISVLQPEAADSPGPTTGRRRRGWFEANPGCFMELTAVGTGIAVALGAWRRRRRARP